MSQDVCEEGRQLVIKMTVLISNPSARKLVLTRPLQYCIACFASSKAGLFIKLRLALLLDGRGKIGHEKTRKHFK